MAERLVASAFLCALMITGQAGATPVDIDRGNRTLSFTLPDSAFAAGDSVLSVDVDGYDVTSFGRIDGATLFLDLDVPLTAGEHSLAVYLFHADGSAEVIVDTIVDAPVLETGAWALNALFETNYRIDEDPAIDYEGVDEHSNTGSLSFETEDTGERFTAGAAVQAIYDRANVAPPANDAWAVPAYALYASYDGDAATASLNGGNIAVAREDLLFTSFQRRGAAFEAATTSGRLHVQGFTVNSTPHSSIDRDFIIPSSGNDHSSGMSATVALADGRLQVGGAVIDGKTSLGGDGFNQPNDAVVYGGDSWNVALDSWFLEESLWIHLEQAESDFDADGIGLGLPSRRDDATQAVLQLSSAGSLGEGPFEYWTAVLQYKRVGREFYSVGNLSQPGNVEVTSAWFQGGFSSIVIDAEFAEEKTNPEGNSLFATQTLERAGASLAWSPVSLDPENRIWQVLGAPSVSAWFYRVENSQPFSQALLAGFDVDDTTDDAGVSISFARDALNWSVEYGVVDFADMSLPVIDNGFAIYEPYSDSRNRHLSVAMSWQPGERVSIDAFLQRNTLEETDFGDEYESNAYGLSGNVILVPGRLGLFASVNQGKDRNRFGDPQFLPEHFESRFANLQLTWRAVDASGVRPAVNLFFKGNYGRNENLAFMIDEDFWAVYVGATVNWTGSN